MEREQVTADQVEPDALSMWFAHRRRRWLRRWRWVLVLLGIAVACVILSQALDAYMLYIYTPPLQTYGTPAYAVLRGLLQTPFFEWLPIVTSLGEAALVAGSIGMVAGLGRYMLSYPPDLVVAVGNRELYLRSRAGLARVALETYWWLFVLPGSTRLVATLLYHSGTGISSPVVFRACTRAYALDGGIVSALTLLTGVLLLIAAQLTLLLRYPRLAVYWHFLAVLVASLLQHILVQTAEFLAQAWWNWMRPWPTLTGDLLGFIILGVIPLLLIAVLWAAVAIPPRRFTGALAE